MPPPQVHPHMLPGMGGRGGGMNPKQVAAMMKQMGITMEDIDDVEEVIIRTRGDEIVITNATVSKMIARGQGTTWQVAGDESRRPRTDKTAAPAAPPGPKFTEDDVALVAEQAKVPKDKARAALEAANGEPAEAILKLIEE